MSSHCMRKGLAAAIGAALLGGLLGADAPPAPVAPGAEASPPIVPGADETPAMPALPETPLAIVEIVAARPFTVEVPWPSDWRADHPMVREGWIAVLRVPHAVAVPRQTAEPVLFAGGTTVERVENRVDEDLVLAIIPSSQRALTETVLWYGRPMLPEAVEPADIVREARAAERAGIGARPVDEVERALGRGGDAITVVDRAALLEALHALAPKSAEPGGAEPN